MVFRSTESKQTGKLLTNADMLETWTGMLSHFERTFVVCDHDHVIATTRALRRKAPLTILSTTIGKPRWNKLTSIAKAHPVDVVVLE